MSTDEYYNSKASEFFESTYNLDMSPIYRKFGQLLPVGANVLDAGCGSGRDSKYFLSQGYSVAAFDSSIELCKLASELIGQDVLHLSFTELNFKSCFDGIWACASLLHLNLNVLGDALLRLNKSLKENGVIYCSFKYGNFAGDRSGRYFQDMDESKLEKILTQTCFKSIEFWKTTDVRTDNTQTWLNCLAKKI